MVPGGGGGGTSVMEGDRDVPLDRVWFCRSSILAQGIKSAYCGHHHWHRVSNRPNVVITIDTGYQNRPSWLWRTTCLSQDHMPIVFYDRPAIRAEARTFFFLLVSSAPPIRQGYPRCAILQQGMHLNVFSKVYYDRVYFSCAERIMTGSGFDPPPPAAPPYPLEKSSAHPPPPPQGRGITTSSCNTLLKSDVTHQNDHVVHCHGSHECWFTLCQFHCQFHSRQQSLHNSEIYNIGAHAQ